MTDYVWLILGLLGVGGLYLLPLNTVWAKAALLALPAGLLAIGLLKGQAPTAAIATGLLLSHGRVAAGRYGPDRTSRIIRRTWRLAALLTLALIGLDWLLEHQAQWLLSLAAAVWLVLTVRSFWLSLSRAVRGRFRPDEPASGQAAPTVTLAIPARNETHALTDCLRSALASDYDKLEILVLDDCSQDSTAEIIRSFAHDGIRFIQGEQPAAGWIGKNQAYQALLDEASGDLVLFAGVDVRFDSRSISLLVTDMQASGAKLYSVMPRRRQLDVLPSLVRPLRYYFQLAFSPWPFMSSVWVAERKWLIEQGGFSPRKHSISPEQELAAVARANDAYRFRRSTQVLGITSRKRAGSLYETAIRTLYPRSGKDPLVALAKAVGWLAVLAAWLAGWWSGVPLVVLGSALLSLSFFISEIALQPGGWWLSGWLLPFNLLSESLLELRSMTAYEFGRVDWKGRNVCLPVMKQRQRPGGAYPPGSRPST